MSYSTAGEVRILINYNDRIDSDYVPDTSTTKLNLTDSISDADAYIDGKLAHLYNVPFSPTPPVINLISKNLAAYFILRSIYTSEKPSDTDWPAKFKTTAIDLLKELLNRKLTLVDSSGDVVAIKSTQGIVSNTENYASTFDLDDVESWEVSPSRLTDISDSRASDS